LGLLGRSIDPIFHSLKKYFSKNALSIIFSYLNQIVKPFFSAENPLKPRALLGAETGTPGPSAAGAGCLRVSLSSFYAILAPRRLP
jgi:hypothetical protein